MFRVQRFKEGSPFYTDKLITNQEKTHGLIGSFGSIFGQIVDVNGNKICYSLERKDTLIVEGAYDFMFYNSPANKCEVILLKDVPNHTDIEFHPANWAYQLKGCCAPCFNINLDVPQGVDSRNAFNKLMALAKLAISNGVPAKIIYEKI